MTDADDRRPRWTFEATTTCVALIVAGFVLLLYTPIIVWLEQRNRHAAFAEWYRGRGEFPLSEIDILLYEIVPMIVMGYLIGWGAIAITRFFFPRSDIMVAL